VQERRALPKLLRGGGGLVTFHNVTFDESERAASRDTARTEVTSC